jgi:hypothetical protein
VEAKTEVEATSILPSLNGKTARSQRGILPFTHLAREGTCLSPSDGGNCWLHSAARRPRGRSRRTRTSPTGGQWSCLRNCFGSSALCSLTPIPRTPHVGFYRRGVPACSITLRSTEQRNHGR